MWESVEKKERRKKRTGVLRSYRISHREVLPVKSQTCQNYWWTSQKPFLQVMLLICFSSTCNKKRFWHSAWCYLNVLVNIITQCYPHYFTEIQATGAPVHTIYQGRVLCAFRLNWCQAFPTVAFKNHTHSNDFLTKYLLIHCPYSFPSLFWSPSHLIVSLAPHPPLKLFAAVDIHLPSERWVLEKSSSCRSNGRKSRCFLSMFPGWWLWRRLALSLCSQKYLSFPKQQEEQFDCTQYCDNKAGCLNESQSQFSYVRELEECCSILPSHFPLLLWVSVSIHGLTLSSNSLCVSLFLHLLLTHRAASVSFLLCISVGEVTTFPVYLVCLSEVEAFRQNRNPALLNTVTVCVQALWSINEQRSPRKHATATGLLTIDWNDSVWPVSVLCLHKSHPWQRSHWKQNSNWNIGS